eukprot:345309_1
MLADIDRTKQINQQIKNLVFGYVKYIIQHHDIPDLVGNLCLLFFFEPREYFMLFDTDLIHYNIQENRVTNKICRNSVCYGSNIIIHTKKPYIFKWTFKIFNTFNL